MKKYIGIGFLFLLLCGCQKQELTVETIVENNNNIIAALTYPTTGISKLDTAVKKYVQDSYDAFKMEYGSFYTLSKESEFNLDYQYWLIDSRYHNIILETFINSSSLAHPINEIKTFVYDENEHQLLTAETFLGKEKLKEIVPILKQELIRKYKDCIILESLDSEITGDFKNAQFTINNEFLTFHFDPYKVTSGSCGVIKVDIPLSRLGIQFTKPTSQERDIITVNKERVIDPNKPVVAITFDDGPSKHTREILSVLQEYDANGTFFVLGNKANTYQDTLREILKQGNEIGNHSYNHKWLTRLDIDDFKEQIEKTQTLIQEFTGYTPALLRPTYGSINKKIRNNTNLKIVLWDVDSLDWKIKNSQKIANRVLKDVDDMDIILFHDTYKRTAEALKKVLSELQKEGYQFVTVSELEQVKILRSQTK